MVGQVFTMSRMLCFLGFHAARVTLWHTRFGHTTLKVHACERPGCAWTKEIRV